MKKTPSLFQTAQRHIAGGVNSPVRAFGAVGGAPVFVKRAKGAHFWGEDGRKYLDFCQSWGASILGHAHPTVLRAAREALGRGTSYGAPTKGETDLAILIKRHLPSIERIRFVSSGTEAAMAALRLARGVTGRPLILKFDGCYHGHSDGLLVKSGSGVSTLSGASSAGVPQAVAAQTLSIPFNDLDLALATIRRQARKVAAVIVEPVPANMGVVLPKPGFLQGLRRETEKHGVILIFDEVITGFRVGLGGAQGHFNIRPDLTLLGKIIGGGFPAAAFGGRRDLMKHLAPEGNVYQAGTLSGNPIAMAAGAAVLGWLAGHPEIYGILEARVGRLASAWRTRRGLTANHLASMFTHFWTERPVEKFEDARKQDPDLFRRDFHRALAAGVYLPPSMYEAVFLCAGHDDRAVRKLVEWM
jgi:glutamate-1-semialdehyde 2,1-aminomutase